MQFKYRTWRRCWHTHLNLKPFASRAQHRWALWDEESVPGIRRKLGICREELSSVLRVFTYRWFPPNPRWDKWKYVWNTTQGWASHTASLQVDGAFRAVKLRGEREEASHSPRAVQSFSSTFHLCVHHVPPLGNLDSLTQSPSLKGYFI